MVNVCETAVLVNVFVLTRPVIVGGKLPGTTVTLNVTTAALPDGSTTFTNIGEVPVLPGVGVMVRVVVEGERESAMTAALNDFAVTLSEPVESSVSAMDKVMFVGEAVS